MNAARYRDRFFPTPSDLDKGRRNHQARIAPELRAELGARALQYGKEFDL